MYGVLDLLGDLGGVSEIFMLVIGFFLAPISQHVFHKKAIKQLYFAKSKKKDIFQNRKTK